MIYYTQLIYVNEGKEALFQQFEDKVLPLLEKYNGKLLYRLRPLAECVIETSINEPYEIHLICFKSKDDFEAFKDDRERQNHLELKDESVAKALLIEGRLL